MARRATRAALRKKPASGRAEKEPAASKTVPPGESAKTATGHAPSKLWVRMYRVGFGDFFVLAVPTPKGPRFVLIDCGVHAGDIGSIKEAVADMAALTGRHLSLVTVTHRHADHISGFASCADQFRTFQVDRIWMSWWDNPGNGEAAAFQASITALASRLETTFAARAGADPRADLAMTMVTNIAGAGYAASGAAAGSLKGNAAALAMLRGDAPTSRNRFKSAPGALYYKAGDTPELPDDLMAAGLRARLLGPPTDAALIGQTRKTIEEYLALSDEELSGESLQPFGNTWNATADDYPPRSLEPFKPGELEHRVQAVLPEALIAAAARADRTINNQSLVVLFTIAGTNLLFAGDAQWGNWANLLFGGPVRVTAETTLPKATRDMLSGVDLYKVGHHGSTNATPVDAVRAMSRGCVALCSTEPGCYGDDVPRPQLLKALEERTSIPVVRSDQVPAGTASRTHGLTATLPAGFSTPGRLFIDYEF